ncbi:MAG TPA: membrane protein insertion efficiency factor YidD [Candidatus Wunengus sp. YC60]|uniref:membrane protein insertion efficiency factor YidD n=1 Tax=Candidatus Wunengus sp. YC60 TaxID=3367697 RepID=UPI004029BDBF
MKYLLIGIIRLYQWFISPILSLRIRCKFYPTCSDYAIKALSKYGTAVGIKKAINRWRSCNPYNGDSCIDYP